jgi:uncharacterized membrane protein
MTTSTASTEKSSAGTHSAGTLNALLLAGVVVIALIFAFSSTGDHWYALFKWIHVTFAIVWIGGGSFITILAIRAQRSGDTAEIVAIARQAAFAGEKVFAPAGLIVFLMGIAMMINTDWGWGTFWIDAGLIGYAATFITGVAVLSPLAKQIQASAAEKGPEHPDTLAVINKILLIARVDISVLLLVVADMVTKPFM